MSRKKMVRKRAGRKSQWPERLLNEMIDIIAGDEFFKKNSYLQTIEIRKILKIMKAFWIK